MKRSVVLRKILYFTNYSLPLGDEIKTMEAESGTKLDFVNNGEPDDLPAVSERVTHPDSLDKEK